MPSSLLELLNRRVYFLQLEASWARPAVKALSDAFYRADPVGLAGLGCPRDEYEPEAALALARLHGFVGLEELWAAPEKRLSQDVGEEAARQACEEAFASLFGGDFSGRFDDELLREVLRCADSAQR